MNDWFDHDTGKPVPRPAWLDVPQRRSLLFPLVSIGFLAFAGFLIWQLLTTITPTMTAVIAPSVSDGDDLLHQQTIEQQNEQIIAGLGDVKYTLIILFPTATPEPTKYPTSTPKAKIVLPSCEPSSQFEDGTECDPYPTPTPKITPTATATPEPCATVWARPVDPYSKAGCYFEWTPTPEAD